MSIRTRSVHSVKKGTTPTGAHTADRTAVALIDGEPYLRASDAARILADAGVPFLATGRRLREHMRDGSIRVFEVHPRAFLYHEADVRAVAERYRSA